MYDEPDWSSLTLPELLDKSIEFGDKAYSATMSTFAFLERSMEASPKHTDLADEIVGLTEQAQRINTLLGELNRDVKQLRQEFPLPVKRES